MLERTLVQKKKEKLQEIDSFFTNLSPEMYNMTMGDLMKMQLGHLQAEKAENEENSTDVTKSPSKESERLGSIDSVIQKALQDLHAVNEDTECQTGKGKRRVKVSKRKKGKKAALLETPCNTMLSDVWKRTPAITPQLQTRIHHATPLTAIREASATDYRGMTFKFVAFNERGSPVAPNELDCPDVMGKLSKLVKKAEKVMEEKRHGQ